MIPFFEKIKMCGCCRDDQILLNGLLYYIFNSTFSIASFLPAWRTDGVIITMLLHAGPVEYLYYWLHRALHHHYLYSRYHSHHHSSMVTEPITCNSMLLLKNVFFCVRVYDVFLLLWQLLYIHLQRKWHILCCLQSQFLGVCLVGLLAWRLCLDT